MSTDAISTVEAAPASRPDTNSDQSTLADVDKQAPAYRAGERAWLAASVGLTLLFAGRTMAPALSSSDVVQGDAREHVFWMARFRDPELFQGDFIADYFQSLAPPAYRLVYWLLSFVVDPLLASKLLPLALGVVAALFTFMLVRRLHPAPTTAFLATVLLSWYTWQYDDLASGTPRAFLLPVLVGHVWAVVTGRLWLAVGLAGLAALFYPVGGAIAVTLLGTRLLSFSRFPPRPMLRGSRVVAFVAAGLLVGAFLLPSQWASSGFGPIVSGEEARTMPEFGPNGRKPFFVEDPYRYWVGNVRSGLDLRVTDVLLPGVPILFEYLAVASLLPLLLLLRGRMASAARVSGHVVILPQLLVASLGLFLLAHALLFRLYLPGRYIKWSVLLVLAVAAGLALGVLIDALGERFGGSRPGLLAGGLALVLGLGLAVYPARYDGNFTRDPHPDLSAYLRTQPRNTLIAGVPNETDQLPSFAARPVLVSREFALPYHLGYYGEIRQRTEDLIEAYYAESLPEVVSLAARYGIDLFLVNPAAFEQATFRQAWNFSRNERPFSELVARKLERSRQFALLDRTAHCATFANGRVAVVPVSCLRAAL